MDSTRLLQGTPRRFRLPMPAAPPSPLHPRFLCVQALLSSHVSLLRLTRSRCCHRLNHPQLSQSRRRRRLNRHHLPFSHCWTSLSHVHPSTKRDRYCTCWSMMDRYLLHLTSISSRTVGTRRHWPSSQTLHGVLVQLVVFIVSLLIPGSSVFKEVLGPMLELT